MPRADRKDIFREAADTIERLTRENSELNGESLRVGADNERLTRELADYTADHHKQAGQVNRLRAAEKWLREQVDRLMDELEGAKIFAAATLEAECVNCPYRPADKTAAETTGCAVQECPTCGADWHWPPGPAGKTEVETKV